MAGKTVIYLSNGNTVEITGNFLYDVADAIENGNPCATYIGDRATINPAHIVYARYIKENEE